MILPAVNIPVTGLGRSSPSMMKDRRGAQAGHTLHGTVQY